MKKGATMAALMAVGLTAADMAMADSNEGQEAKGIKNQVVNMCSVWLRTVSLGNDWSSRTVDKMTSKGIKMTYEVAQCLDMGKNAPRG